MKRALHTIGIVLFVVYALLPVGTLTARVFGYSFVLASPAAFAVVTAAVSVAAAVTAWRPKGFRPNKAERLFYTASAPLAGVNWVFYMVESSTVTVNICMLISFLCAILLTARLAAPLALKLVGSILAVLMILPLAFLSFLTFIFGDIAANTVVRTVPSPDGGYYAEVIDSDQGALGGDTIVNVYSDRQHNFGLFRITKKSKRVYMGEWGEYRSITIDWEDDNTLIINGKRYDIE